MILAGCSDMGDPVKVDAPPVGTAVSYVNDVRPIFNTHGCLTCHTSGSTTDFTGILTSYSTFVSVPSFINPPVLIVKPGDPGNSVLYNRIENTGVYGELMPQGGPQMPKSDRDLIRDWILQGALNN